ncbi:uncharacterized protein LOC117788843 [Drosophila innubila]|uniref:uncharacterized protein LOC117788843 n=1 Tax=Drosophila innubila TaxID=198719 RepID=UPI00148BB33D|nr:uncharacterized protein LOC117788843 [Drosophila innubila]
MKLLQVWILCLGICLCLCLGTGQARRLQQRREANAAPEPAPVPVPEQTQLPESELDGDDSARKEIFVSDATTTSKPLAIVAIKSRAIAMDRGLCQEQSRYRPHYPKCHQYCKKLDHWIGQCWRESCHCIS